MLRNLLWRAVARLVSRPRVSAWIIARAQRTPYGPIMTRDGSRLYMDRWWLFNPYSKDAAGNAGPARWAWLPSVRVHHIVMPDDDDHLHSHPWQARTIVLRGWYVEERPWLARGELAPPMPLASTIRYPRDDIRVRHARRRGYTGPVRYEQWHRITEVPADGVYTLWFTWKYMGTWGFLVDGKMVPWREYLGVPSK